MSDPRQLLDFSGKLDVALLDNVVSAMFEGSPHLQQQDAQQLLNEFQEHPEAWTRVDAILEFSQSMNTKYFALKILESLIQTRWKVLPVEQREAIKDYIVNLAIESSSDDATLETNRVFINKINLVLVEILKHEWPHNWPTFISDIVGASKTSESMCQNNMVILKLLSEEVFDFSSGKMTLAKAKHLKDTMCNEFSQVFQLCMYVLENSARPALLTATLGTLLKFLNWIPLGYIFETNLMTALIFNFLRAPAFRNLTLMCLTEVGSLQAAEDKYGNRFVQLFDNTMGQIRNMLDMSSDLRTLYQHGSSAEQDFIQNLALFFCGFLKEHAGLIEAIPEQHGNLLDGLNYLVLISHVDDVEIFKICLEYWNFLAASLYNESPFSVSTASNNGGLGLVRGRMAAGPMTSPRRALYAPILSKVRSVMVSRMAKPEEVLVVENDRGEVVREFMKDTDAITMYKSSRECLVYLTHLDYVDTETIMRERLDAQVHGPAFSWKGLNTLCWAIGSISGAMSEDDEKRFLVVVIKELLGLCENKRGKDNKAVIASNIMYTVGQYPRFLRAHWKFLKTVVNKLFEFMHETHDGVQDMACDTFIKISQKCRRLFVSTQSGERTPFIDEILDSMSTLICDLSPLQVHTFYEAVGYMISAQTDPSTRERLIERYMAIPNMTWDRIISECAVNVDILKDMDTVQQLGHILKINVRACTSTGHPFVAQLGRNYLDMLNVYKYISELISSAIASSAHSIMQEPLIRAMRIVKKETLLLLETWVAKSEDPQMVLENFIPPLLDAVLGDFARNIPVAREAGVLSLMAAIVNKLESLATPFAGQILETVFGWILDMIDKDFSEFPEHRTNFYILLQAVNSNCFEVLVELPPEQFKLIIDAVVWAIQHTMRQVADIGLQVMQDLIMNTNSVAEARPEFAQRFYQQHMLQLLQHVLAVFTDSSHAAGFKLQAGIIQSVFATVESGVVTVPLVPSPEAANMDNMQALQWSVGNTLSGAFPHLQPVQIERFLMGVVRGTHDLQILKNTLRDFLVHIRQFSSGEDDIDLQLEAAEAERQLAEAERKRAVPGLINNNTTDDMTDDL